MRASFAYWAPSALLAAVVLAFSLVPSPGGPSHGWDKAYHFAAYAAIAFLVTRSVAKGEGASAGAVAASVALTFAFGVMVELLQSFTPTREADVLDAAANGLGAILGAVLWRLVKNRRMEGRC